MQKYILLILGACLQGTYAMQDQRDFSAVRYEVAEAARALVLLGEQTKKTEQKKEEVVASHKRLYCSVTYNSSFRHYNFKKSAASYHNKKRKMYSRKDSL